MFMRTSGAKRVAIAGGGVVGLATAWRLMEMHPQVSIVVLEKEREVGTHQTGRNSGVLHSGIYYKPGSLKAANCRAGKAAMEAFCSQHDIPFENCGKVIVATHSGELANLQALYERGLANGVSCERIDKARLAELEPHCDGIQAILVRETGIVNYRVVCQRLQSLLEARGHEVRTGQRVQGLHEQSDGVVVETNGGETTFDYVVNCGGLYSDLLNRLAGGGKSIRIVPFRGEYYELKPDAAHLCKNLIYPVPDPRFPFLGVHFTRMISGHVECGPNAVLAFAREGYRLRDVNLGEMIGLAGYSGFLKMSARYWKTGLMEMWRSLSKPAFVKALQRLLPDVRPEHLVRAPAGVRAQALASDGRLLDDFAFEESPRMVHVLNAPSPAATASLSIGATIAERMIRRFG